MLRIPLEKAYPVAKFCVGREGVRDAGMNRFTTRLDD